MELPPTSLKSCLKKSSGFVPTFAPAPVPQVPAAPLPVAPPAVIISDMSTPAPQKRGFDTNSILLVVIIVGLIFGGILIFLLFRLRRMELQLQQATKNFNMQTVREMIAQEIQDTVESLEIEEMSRQMEICDLAEKREHNQTGQDGSSGTGARFLRGSQPHVEEEEEPMFFMGGAQEARFIIPSLESLGEMFVGIVPSTGSPGHIEEDDRIEEIVEDVVEQKEEPEIPRQKVLRAELHVEPVQQVQQNVESTHAPFFNTQDLVPQGAVAVSEVEAVAMEVEEVPAAVAAAPEVAVEVEVPVQEVEVEVPVQVVTPAIKSAPEVEVEVPVQVVSSQEVEVAVQEASVVEVASVEEVQETTMPDAAAETEKPVKKGKRATKHNPTETPNKRTKRTQRKPLEDNEIDINDL